MDWLAVAHHHAGDITTAEAVVYSVGLVCFTWFMVTLIRQGDK